MKTRNDRLLLNAHDVALMLNISRALAYRWMQDGTLPALRAPVGRVVRVPRAALEQWIERNTYTGKGGGAHA
ncbi:MAG: helix-turn-helix domain-containing protein [Candidatus Solibacter sp.]|nr:helix-turn-helix domain-containing protein [Candidatus Solibacter sp.]